MVTPEISPRAFFALRTDVKNNAHYISDFQILYPAGSVLIVHNYYEKRQKFIKLFEKSISLEMIVVSPSRKVAALIENGEKGQILIFDLRTLKRKRTLNLPNDAITNRFETISFSYDDVYIMAITGEPDWNMVMYNWVKGKVTSTFKVANPISVTQVLCSPSKVSEICLIGPGLFRLLTLTETVWRQYGFQKADQINVTSAAYIDDEKLVCGTSDGRLFLVDNGDLKGVYNAITATTLKLKEKDESAGRGSSTFLVERLSDGSHSEDLTVRTIISFPKGFAYSCKVGYVHMFEKEGNIYKKRNVFVISHSQVGDLQQDTLYIVKHLSINMSQDKLLATTNRAQIYTVRLWGPDIAVAPEIPFKHLGEPLHHGSIIGLTMSVWKPIFVTGGKTDRTVRLWNYETETVQIVKQFTEEIYSVELHPTGNFLAIGFAQKLHYTMVLMNDIQLLRQFPTPECRLSRFSSHGQFIAAVNEGVIEIYGTIMFQSICKLRGHTDRVNALRWNQDDTKMVSCGADGGIIIWDVVNGTVLRDIQTPDVCYWDIALSSDGKYIYVVGDDGLLKEIAESFTAKSVTLNQKNIDKIALSRSNLMLFLTGDSSAVLSVKMPLTQPPEYAAFFYHSTKITQLKLSFDDMTLVTISEGGSVIIWKLSHTEGKTVSMDKNFIYSTEVLINKGELEEKIVSIKSLSQQLYELEMGHAREMRDSEANYVGTIKEIRETFVMSIEELKEKIEQTEVDQNNQLVAIKKDVDELREKHEKEKRVMIENYTNKLLVEYEKVRVLDEVKAVTISNFDNLVKELQQSKEKETNEIIQIYEEKLKDVNNILQESYKENAVNLEKHEKSKQWLQEDANRELVETRAKYEATLKEEKELNTALKEEAVFMKKKHAEVQKEKDEFLVKAEVLQVEHQKFQASIQALEKDVADLKAEIMERDVALDEKDKRITDLKQKITELEKFKFVLDYKIKELKNQIDPKDREIREKKDQITDMEVELDNLKKLNASLELQSVELKEKIFATEREVNAYEKKYKAGFNTLRQIKVDIYSLYQELNDFVKLKDGIKSLYHKYHQIEIDHREQYGDTDFQRELMIQREFLEKTIMALKSTLKKTSQNKRNENKVLQDNVILLEELNNIRKELKIAITSVKNLEKLIGIKGKKTLVSREAFNNVEQRLKQHENTTKMYQKVILDIEGETATLNAKVKAMEEKLRGLVLKLQSKTKFEGQKGNFKKTEE